MEIVSTLYVLEFRCIFFSYVRNNSKVMLWKLLLINIWLFTTTILDTINGTSGPPLPHFNDAKILLLRAFIIALGGRGLIASCSCPRLQLKKKQLPPPPNPRVNSLIANSKGSNFLLFWENLNMHATWLLWRFWWGWVAQALKPTVPYFRPKSAEMASFIIEQSSRIIVHCGLLV